jgi:hypothetical protein
MRLFVQATLLFFFRATSACVRRLLPAGHLRCLTTRHLPAGPRCLGRGGPWTGEQEAAGAFTSPLRSSRGHVRAAAAAAHSTARRSLQPEGCGRTGLLLDPRPDAHRADGWLCPWPRCIRRSELVQSCDFGYSLLSCCFAPLLRNVRAWS